MSKLNPKKFSKLQVETSEALEKGLSEWGFQHYVRYCQQPSKDYYGETISVIEDWSNEDIADFIVTDLLKTITVLNPNKQGS